MNRKKITFYIDLIFCVLFLPLVITLIPVDRWLEKYTSFAVSLVLFLYLLYFFYRKVKFPKLFLNGQYRQLALYIIGVLLCTFLMSNFPFPQEAYMDSSRDIHILKHLRQQTVWFLFLVVSGFSLTIELTFELFNQILSRKDAEAEKNKAELSLYKAQIDPHFLFNSLNTLYGFIVNKSEKTEEVFVKFTGILQYMYTHTTHEKIHIEQEIEYINHYIDLQTMRYNHHTKVEWDYSFDDENCMIPPMILITFVENAFKYGSSPSKDCLIRIHLEVRDGILDFKTENTIMKRKEEGKKSIGIENCKRRLALLYPDQFILNTKEENQQFKVHLTIHLT